MLGYRADEVVGKLTPMAIHDPAEIAARAAELGMAPGFGVFVAAARQGEAETREWTYVRKDDSRLTVSLTVTAMYDDRGEISGFLGIAGDITERKRAEEQTRFLERASTLLASSLDYETTLRRVARLSVPILADLCIVDVVGQDRSVDRLAVAHVDPAREEPFRVLSRCCPPDPEGPHPLMRALATGRPQVYPEFPPSLLTAIAHDAEHLEILRAMGMKSLMVVPLVARGQTLGAISFVSAESGRRYGTDDLALAEEIARRCAVADQGIGILTADLPHVFERFHRGRNVATQIAGTGIGLAGARQIVEQHGGSIAVESQEGRGSTFTVRLPLATSGACCSPAA